MNASGVFYCRSVLICILPLSLTYGRICIARTHPAKGNRISAFAECVTVLGHRLQLDPNDFTDSEIMGESSDDIRFLLGDVNFERRLGRALARMPDFSRLPDSSSGSRKDVQRLWSERRIIAIRLDNHDMADDWADHLRKGFSAKEKELRRQLGDETYRAVSAEILREVASK
jgi:hypothetical protein